MFGSSEIWTPVPWTKGQSWTHITSQPLHKKISKTSNVIVQSNLAMAGDSKIQKLKNIWNLAPKRPQKFWFFSIAISAEYLFELISIVHWVPQFIGHNKIFLGSVALLI